MNMDRKIKICIVSYEDVTSPQTWSGTMLTLYTLLKKRNDVELCQPIEYNFYQHPIYKYFYQYISKYIYTWKSSQDFFLRYIIKRILKKQVKNYPCNNIDFFLFPAMANPLVSELPFKGKTCVYTDCLMSDLDINRIYKPFKILGGAYYKYFIKKDISQTDILLTQNNWSAKRFCEFCKIPSSKVHNIRFGINLKFYEGEKDYTNKKLLIVLRKGAEHAKGLDVLLKAFKLVHNQIPEATLHIVGTDIGTNEPGVKCYYNQPREITVKLFNESSLYVMPALREPNGITYLEALANKTPIIGFNRYSFPEFTGNGKWGFICKKETIKGLAETIIYALREPERLNEMGINGQKFVLENYTWEQTIDKMVSIMKNKVSVQF